MIESVRVKSVSVSCAVVFALLVSSCGDSDTSAPTTTTSVDQDISSQDDPDDVQLATEASSRVVVLEWLEYGDGCTPTDRCGHYTVYLDGTVEAARANGDVLTRATVDLEPFDDVVRSSRVVPELVELLPEGLCQAEDGGVSQQVWAALQDLRLDTCDVDLSIDIGSPYMNALYGLGEAAVAAAPIDWDVANAE